MKQRGGKEGRREKDSGRDFDFQNTSEALPGKICFSWNKEAEKRAREKRIQGEASDFQNRPEACRFCFSLFLVEQR